MRPISSLLDRTSLSNNGFFIRPKDNFFLRDRRGKSRARWARLAARAANSLYLARTRIQPYDTITLVPCSQIYNNKSENKKSSSMKKIIVNPLLSPPFQGKKVNKPSLSIKLPLPSPIYSPLINDYDRLY